MAEPMSKEYELPIDKTVVVQICDEVKYNMLKESFNPDNSFYLPVRFLEKMQHAFYNTWDLHNRKRVIYLDVDNEEIGKEMIGAVVSFIAKLGDIMNSIIVVNCVSNKLALLIHKCLQSLLVSSSSLYDLIKISIPKDNAYTDSPNLRKTGKNRYNALLTSKEEIKDLIDNLCLMISQNDTMNNDSYRLIWISKQELPNQLHKWKISNYYFQMQQTPIELVSSNGAWLTYLTKDKDLKDNDMDRVLTLIIQKVPLKEFVHSNSQKIVQYLMKERFIHRDQDRASYPVKDSVDSYLLDSSCRIDPTKTFNPEQLEEIRNTPQRKITSGYKDEYVVTQSEPVSLSGIQPVSIQSTRSIDVDICNELGEALTEALHNENTQIIGSMFKSICIHLDKVKFKSQLIEFFNFEYLSKQYNESFERNENYFQNLMRKLGMKGNKFEITATFLDGIIEKLMYKNIYHPKSHQKLDSKPNDSKQHFQLYLFIWGILTQNIDIAEQALRWYPHTNEQITTALAGSRLLEGIIRLLKNDHEISSESIRDLGEKKIYFENLALSLLKEEEIVHENNVNESKVRNINVGVTLAINELQTLRNNNPIPKNKYTVISKNKYKRLEAYSTFWKSTTIEIAHEGECRLFISSEEVQTYVHQKNIDYHVTKKLLVDLILFHLAFYIFHCLLSLKLVAEPYNSSQLADIIYLGLLSVYGVLVIIFMIDNLLRTIIQKNPRSFTRKRCMKIFTPYRSDGYLKLIFYISFMIGYPLRILEVTLPDFTWRFSAVFFSFNSLLLFIELLRKALSIYRKLSITIHLFISSIKKNIQLVILAIIFMIGFGVAQYILKCSQTACKLHSDRGIWDYFLWIFLDTFKIMFGSYEVRDDVIEEATPLLTTLNYSNINLSYSAEWLYLSSTFSLVTLLVVWQFMSHIIIINLLIANFIKIYEDISKEADLLWKQELLKTYFRYKDWSFIPFYYLPLFKKNVRHENVKNENDENETSSYRPSAGRYWRQRDEEERQQLNLSSNQDKIENIVLSLVASNDYTRRHIHRIENFLRKIHNEKVPAAERDNKLQDSFEDQFEI
ncbi:hypothetical protein LOD99_13129 [Oopsacas minuta]|uniref:Uncharacterized protein n=1 Tax=Oopsacas minuta TaxID=111878 RepID=A0AAV7JAX1_9METZ|nr:hypothetical protein LOD99_13129 [Oopsacas minuta]